MGHQETKNLEKIEGWYGSAPSADDLVFIRNTLLETLTKRLKEENAETWFIPRFLGATAIFVLVFFVLSYAIRDPLPFVDEALIALATAVLVFWSWSRAGLESLQFKFQLSEIEQKVSQAMFYCSNEVQRMEAILDHAETLSPLELFASLEEESNKPPMDSSLMTLILQQECHELKKLWNRFYPKLRASSPAKRAALIENMMGEGKDLPLLYLFFKVRSASAGSLPSGVEVP